MRRFIFCLLLASLVSHFRPGSAHPARCSGQAGHRHLLRHHGRRSVPLDGNQHRRASRLHEGGERGNSGSAQALRRAKRPDPLRTHQALGNGRRRRQSKPNTRPIFLPGTSHRQKRLSPDDSRRCGRSLAASARSHNPRRGRETRRNRLFRAISQWKIRDRRRLPWRLRELRSACN